MGPVYLGFCVLDFSPPDVTGIVLEFKCKARPRLLKFLISEEQQSRQGGP